ncbi:TIGR03862 family flavoprotein [Roseiarcaceae bacterium H3SJ34-1]|uniref:NAD(P)/FAD-dependent oxidoreductase n=1 Tax=Terripilifer ovatus TaxID=3032367 RepID=UPI003AB9A5E4|nr:TIGR03862 family flavoprotein [Roseiarcaceae bacterium H3SJ34-1]
MSHPHSGTAIVIGGGPAGLMAAEILARNHLNVTVYDRMPSLARKFLLAGRGGLNLTHSEPLERFMQAYGAAAEHLRPFIEAFPPQALRAWSEDLGVPTFVGSSGRVFPKSFKASPLLRAWLRRLESLGARVQYRHRFDGFDAQGRALFTNGTGEQIIVAADATVLALGGASWPRLGSDGGWRQTLAAAGMTIAPLRPSNCGFEIDWSPQLQRFAGAPLKNVALSFGPRTVRGEAMIAGYGLEGGSVYALSGPLRDAIAQDGSATLHVDLRPDVSAEALTSKLAADRGKASLSNFLRKAAGLTPQAIALLREAGPLPVEPALLAARIKHLPLKLERPRPIARAISSAGGVAFEDVDNGLMLKRMPGVFVAGEMLDWEAPTGGYLLQACFSTGFAAGEAAAKWVKRDKG